MRIPKGSMKWIYLVFIVKFVDIAISALARGAGWGWVPQPSNLVIGVAIAFAMSSIVFLHLFPRLGIISTASYGLLTEFSALNTIAPGQYVLWATIVAISSVALIALAVQSWRQLSKMRRSIES